MSPALSTLRTAGGTAFSMMPATTRPAPLLLLLASTGADTLTTLPYGRTGHLLADKGWAVVSLDLPCHGADRRDGEPVELAGWTARIGKGENIVAAFQQRVNDVVRHLVRPLFAGSNQYSGVIR